MYWLKYKNRLASRLAMTSQSVQNNRLILHEMRTFNVNSTFIFVCLDFLCNFIRNKSIHDEILVHKNPLESVGSTMWSLYDKKTHIPWIWHYQDAFFLDSQYITYVQRIQMQSTFPWELTVLLLLKNCHLIRMRTTLYKIF